MIKFRQKEFFWGMALNAAGAIGTGLSLKQGSDQIKLLKMQRIIHKQHNKQQM